MVMEIVIDGWEIMPGLQLAGEHERKHSEIGQQGPKRVAKGSRAIMFNQKMTGPGKAVANERQGKPPQE